MIEFKGLKHFPKGDAKINLKNNGLHIENITPSGFDGVIVDTEFNDFLDVYFKEIELNEGSSISIRYSGRDDRGRVKTRGELSIIAKDKNPNIFINSWLINNRVTVIGKNNGQLVFNEVLKVPTTPDVNWWPIAIAAAALLSCHYKKTKTTDSDGNVTTTEEWGVDFGGSSRISVDDTSGFTGDYLGFIIERDYPRGINPSVFAPVNQLEIVGTGINELVIINENYGNF
jgi:hypothetical protein